MYLIFIFSQIYAKVSNFGHPHAAPFNIPDSKYISVSSQNIHVMTLLYRVVSYMKTLCKVESIVKVKILTYARRLRSLGFGGGGGALSCQTKSTVTQDLGLHGRYV